MRVLLHVILKELLQLKRDKKMIPVIFVAPALQILALGYAANLDVNRVPMVLVDQDRSAASRTLVADLEASGIFEVVAAEDEVAQAGSWLEKGAADMVLVLGTGLGEAVAGAKAPRVQILADGSDAVAAGIGLSYANALLAERSQALVAGELRRLRQPSGAGGVPRGRPAGRIVDVPRVWYNPDLQSRWFYVPAVLAMVLMILTMVLSSMGVVREKEIGTMEQLIVSPIQAWQLVVGKLFPFAAIGLVNIFIVTGITVGWFEVPLRGSLLLLVLVTLLLLLNTLGLGLLVSTLVRTQQQAMMTATFLFMVPMIYLSGLLFPIENMPRTIQWVTYAIPLRYYAQILRGIFLKGAGIDTLWPQSLALAAFGLSFLTLAAMRFRKRLD